MQLIVVSSIFQLSTALKELDRSSPILCVWRSRSLPDRARSLIQATPGCAVELVFCDSLATYARILLKLILKSFFKGIDCVVVGDKRSLTNRLAILIKSKKYLEVSDGLGDSVSDSPFYPRHSAFVNSLKYLAFLLLPNRKFEENSSSGCLFLKNTDSKKSVFLGQCLSERGTITLEEEIVLLETVVASLTNLQWFYCSHPNDSAEKIKRLSGLGLSIICPDITVEHWLRGETTIPKYYVTFYSTSALTIKNEFENVTVQYSGSILKKLSSMKADEVKNIFNDFESRGIAEFNTQR